MEYSYYASHINAETSRCSQVAVLYSTQNYFGSHIVGLRF